MKTLNKAELSEYCAGKNWVWDFCRTGTATRNAIGVQNWVEGEGKFTASLKNCRAVAAYIKARTFDALPLRGGAGRESTGGETGVKTTPKKERNKMKNTEEKQSQPKMDLGFKIVILDRGFVYAGSTTIDGDYVRVTNVRNIRKWGTIAGLGQIGETGPTENTVMDKCPDILVPLKAVILFMSCKHSF